MKKRIIFTIIICTFMGSITFARENSEIERSRIKRLFELNGNFVIAEQLTEMTQRLVVKSVMRQRPEIPEHAYEKVEEELDKYYEHKIYGKGGLSERMIKTYEEHFNESDIETMITFFDSQTGRKLIKHGNFINQEIKVKSDKWVEEMMPDVTRIIVDTVSDEYLKELEKGRE